MSAIVYQLRDFQSKKDLARIEADLQGQASNLMHEMLFGAPVYASADLIGQTYQAPEKDPA